jgi:hypothetical protein
LDFIIESDYKSFRKIILKRLLEDFTSHYENTYTDEAYKQYKTLDLRKSRTFASEYFFCKRHKGYYDEFGPIEARYPLITGETRFGHEASHSFQIATISGLKIAIISMLADKNCNFLKESYGREDQKRIKIILDEDFTRLTDAPDNILNSKENFDKATRALPFTGDDISFLSFAVFDYPKAKSELQSINHDIASDSKDIFAGL